MTSFPRALVVGVLVGTLAGGASAQTAPPPPTDPVAPSAIAPMAAPPSAQESYDREALSVGLDEAGELAFFESTSKLDITPEQFYLAVGRSDLASGAWWRVYVRDYASEVGWGVGIAAVVVAITVFAFGGQFVDGILPTAPDSVAGVPFGESLPLIGAIVVFGGIGAALGAAIGFGAPLFAQEPALPELQKMARDYNATLATRLGLDPNEVDLYASSVGSGVAVRNVTVPQAAGKSPLQAPRREDDFLTRDVENERTVRVALVALHDDIPAQVEATLAAAIDPIDNVRPVSPTDKPYAQEPFQSCGREPVCLAQVAGLLRAKLAVGYGVVTTESGVLVTFSVVDRKGRVLTEQTVSGADLPSASAAAGRSLTSSLAALAR